MLEAVANLANSGRGKEEGGTVKSRFFSLSMLVCLAMMFFVKVVSAQEVKPLEPDWLLQMYEEGWQKVQEGVLRRNVGDGRVETFGYGAEGYLWLIESYREQATYFEGKYRQEPTDELASLIDGLTDEINRLQGEALAAPAAESFDGEQIDEGCSLSYDATAAAGPQTSGQGVTASASAYFHNNCGTTGNIYASAYAHATKGTVATTEFQEDPKNDGALIDSSASASADGSLECESIGQASVEIPALNIFYTAADSNYECPVPLPLAVSVSGPPTATVDYYGSTCATVTWTATPTNGHPGYTYAWYIDYDPKRSNTLQGTGSTLTKSYCTTSRTYDAMVVVTDSDGHTATATSATDFTYKRQIVPTITGPATVSTNTTTPCADVTWTASATGTGHSPFTYNWYFGTTLQGSGSTLTKRYCSTSATVNVKLVASSSDGHSDNTTFTTTITYNPTPPPLTASISGPANVYLSGSTCQNVTWTSTVSGGTPAYTYSWTIGTSTTVLSTASTLTRSVCSAGTLNVKLTVRDSAAKTANPTFTTQAYTSDPDPIDPCWNYPGHMCP